jgi:hypothetical protein
VTATAEELFVIPQLLLDSVQLPAPMMRATALVKDGGYLTVSRFLREMTSEELGEVLQYGMAARGQRGLQESMTLFCMLLANHEGLVVFSTDPVGEMLGRLIVLVQAEIMVRKGLVELEYSALTLESIDPRNMRMTEKGKHSFPRMVIKRLPPPAAAQ